MISICWRGKRYDADTTTSSIYNAHQNGIYLNFFFSDFIVPSRSLLVHVVHPICAACMIMNLVALVYGNEMVHLTYCAICTAFHTIFAENERERESAHLIRIRSNYIMFISFFALRYVLLSCWCMYQFNGSVHLHNFQFDHVGVYLYTSMCVCIFVCL